MEELKTNPDVRVARALVKIEGTRAKDLVMKTISDQNVEFQNEMMHTLQAVEAVVSRKWKEAVACGAAAIEPLLLEAKEGHDSDFWEQIVTSLAKVGDHRVFDYLMSTLKHESKRRWKKGTVEALGILGDPRAVPELISLLRPGHYRYDDVVAEKAIEALGRIGGQEAERAITEYRKVRVK